MRTEKLTNHCSPKIIPCLCMISANCDDDGTCENWDREIQSGHIFQPFYINFFLQKYMHLCIDPYFFKMFIDIKNENCLYQKTLHNSPWLYEWGNIFLWRFVGYVIITSDVERFNHISIENSKWVCTECRSELRYTGAFDKMLKGIYRQLNIMQCVKIW